MRVYTIYFVDNNKIGSDTNQVGYLLGMIALVAILFQIMREPSYGYMIAAVWMSDSIFYLLGNGVSKIDSLHIANAVIASVVFIISCFMWWKVYDFNPIKKMIQANRLPKNNS